MPDSQAELYSLKIHRSSEWNDYQQKGFKLDYTVGSQLNLPMLVNKQQAVEAWPFFWLEITSCRRGYDAYNFPGFAVTCHDRQGRV